VKPVATERLAKTVARLRAAPAAAADAGLADTLRTLMAPPPGPRRRYILAGQGATARNLDVADVRFLRSDDKYTIIASSHGEYVIRTSITELVSRLDPQQFWQATVFAYHRPGYGNSDPATTRATAARSSRNCARS
jgi:DNA-binding LytR/AlgR family response regulator